MAQPERAGELALHLAQLRSIPEVEHDQALVFETERVEALLFELAASSIGELDLARVAYDRAASTLGRLPVAADLRTRLEASEAASAFTLRHVGVLLRLSEASRAYADDADRAWLFFRGRRWAPFRRLPVFPTDQCILEFMTLPGDAVRVGMHWRGSFVWGRLPTTVRELSAAQKRVQDALWAARPQRETQDELVGQCEAIETYLTEVQDLLVEREVAWSEACSESIKSRVIRMEIERLSVVPHGPTTAVPWGALFLNALGRPIEIVVACPSRGNAFSPDVSITRRPFLRVRGNYQATAVRTKASAERITSELESSLVAGLLGHGRFDHEDIYLSFLHVADAAGASCEFSLQHILELAAEARPMPALVVGACESGEVSRVRKLMDYVHFPWAFLMLGCPWVMAPTWPFTSLADQMLKRLVRDVDFHQFPGWTSAAFARRYQSWLSARASKQIGDVVKSCLATGSDLPLLDIVGWTCYGHHPSAHVSA